MFQEPDLNSTFTAICTEATKEARKSTSDLGLAGNTKKRATPNTNDPTLSEVIDAMIDTDQIQGRQNVLEHGVSVYRWVWKFYRLMEGDDRDAQDPSDRLRVPSWLTDNWKMFEELISTNMELIKRYTVFHDIGKPYVREVGEDGKVHYPSHSEASAELSLKLFKNPELSELIRFDMFFHTCKAEDVEEAFRTRDTRLLLINLFVSLCEVHSNAELFGGFDSTSFKIKWKQIDKRGRQLLRLIQNNN